METKQKKYYCGIGARDCPTEVLGQMTYLAGQLEQMGWWLRSGGAAGSDSAFQKGVKEKAQIWLPWPSFSKDSQEKFPRHQYKVIGKNDADSLASVYKFHPAPERLSQGAMLLLQRNHYQLKGLNEPDSSFVICWTKKGEAVGGSGQNIKAANHYGIPVFNLFNLTPLEILDKVTHGKF